MHRLIEPEKKMKICTDSTEMKNNTKMNYNISAIRAVSK